MKAESNASLLTPCLWHRVGNSLLLSAFLVSFAVEATTAAEVPKIAEPDVRSLPEPFKKTLPASLQDLKTMERHVQALIKKVNGAVVSIELGSTTGSGVVVTPDGLVLTAGHVVNGLQRSVTLRFPDGKTVKGKRVGLEQDTDTGLMRIMDAGPWPFAGLGDLKGLQPGNWVLAMGHPGGFDSRRSTVSRFGRIVRLSPEMVQTDCTIAHGDSGGPLFDMYGRVIAIHNEISGSLSGNFHVPTTVYYKVWDRLIAGDVPLNSLAYLGAQGENATGGYRVTAVEENGLAARGGLQVGDVIRKVNGNELKAFLGSRAGENLKIEIERDGRSLVLDVKADRLPSSVSAEAASGN